jgi:hypothetical protein
MTESEAIKEFQQNIDMPFGSNISREASKLAIQALEKQIAKKAKWNIDTVPKCEKGTTSDEVLVTIEKASIITGEIYSRVVKALYIPHHNCSLEDLEWNVDEDILDGWEYTEDGISWWIPQGWYEVHDYCDDYEYSKITDKVVAWRKLPKPYEQRKETI